MTLPRAIGILLIIGGIVLVIVGINATHSLADRANNALTGRYTSGTTWYIVGGAAAIVAGVVAMFTGPRGRHA